MNKIDIEFSNLISELSDDEFWEWVRGFYDEQLIIDAVNCWDEELKKEEMENMKIILHSQKGQEVGQSSPKKRG